MLPSLKVKRLAGALGAEVSGVDLTAVLTEQTVAAIRAALLEHKVLFFHDQPLTPAQLLAFGRYFAPVIEYPFVKGIEGFPEVIPVVKLEHERANFGGIWHSDTTYLECPPMGSILVARELPPRGGDTIFANMTAAYEALSTGMRSMLDGLYAINSSAKADVTKTREDAMKGGARNDARKEYTARHPVVRTHPETGRKALFVNVGHTLHFDGMSMEESAPLLNFLFRHQVRPEFTCQFRWRPGSIAFWDNRCTQHNPINDYHGYRRVMHRITLAGDRPS